MNIDSFRALLDAWPQDGRWLGLIAEDIGVTAVHAQNMWRRDNIPPKHWDDLLAAAQRRGLSWCTKERLADLAMVRDSRRSQRQPAKTTAQEVAA